MRDKIILLISTVAFLVLVITMTRGIKIGNFQISSIKEIIEKNQETNEKIEKASTLTSIDYPNSIKKLEETYERYELKKQKYDEMFELADENGVYEVKQYDIVYLWGIFGKYAKINNLIIELKVKSNGSKEGFYDLNFTIIGRYPDISQFINSIENASDLYFRIDNFKISGDENMVTSTFTVKNIKLDPKTLKESASSQDTSNEKTTNETSSSENTVTQ